MDQSQLKRLRESLRECALLLPHVKQGEDVERLNHLFKTICGIVFTTDFDAQIWDEGVLLQLQKLFEVKSPNQKVYGDTLARLSERARIVQQVNDLFFSILSNDYSEEEVFQRISAIADIEQSLLQKLQASNHLNEIRLNSKASPSEKIESFLNHLIQDLGVHFGEIETVLANVICSVKAHESAGEVNALLVEAAGNAGVLIPVHVQIQPGDGKVRCLVPGGESFATAVERARHALVNGRFLNGSDNVLFSLEITDASYSGDSIGLAAAIGMYAAGGKRFLDPYTAFTGNINLYGGQFRIQAVKGIKQKLDAAILSGCRRVFLPKENQADVESHYQEKLQIHYVEEIIEVFLKLQTSTEPLPGDTLQIRKINFLQAYCLDKGFHIAGPETIQNGVQFTVTPIEPPELMLNIYDTGVHFPKTHSNSEFQELFDTLAVLDQSKIAIQKVEEILMIKNPDLRAKIQESLDRLNPKEKRTEPHCNYSCRFEDGSEKIIIKQYTNGKLQLQGRAGDLYRKILEPIIHLYNLEYPKAQISVESYLKTEAEETSKFQNIISKPSLSVIPLPHIGTDESGKGDYFGPMVVAGVLLDASSQTKLETLGVKDSKLLSDKRCRELAEQIRNVCKGKFEEVEISPERYNTLYDEFKKEKKNLNHLLAWGHARAIESLMERHPCHYAIADQFGDEKYIISKLMEKSKALKLIQTPKGERYIAVAAASILARDRFLARIEKLSQEYGVNLPKGASDSVLEPARQIVQKKGKNELKKVVKLHHKTTQKVLGGFT